MAVAFRFQLVGSANLIVCVHAPDLERTLTSRINHMDLVFMIQ